MEKMQKNADYYEKSADCAAGIGKNMRYDTIFLMRTEKKSHVIYKNTGIDARFNHTIFCNGLWKEENS